MTVGKATPKITSIILAVSLGINLLITGIYIGSFFKPNFKKYRELRSTTAMLISIMPEENRSRLRGKIVTGNDLSWSKIDRRAQRNAIQEILLKKDFRPEELREILLKNAKVISMSNKNLINALVQEISDLKNDERFILVDKLWSQKK